MVYQENDIDFEISFYEGVLQKKPDFLQALMALGHLYTKKGQHKKALEIDKQLSQLRPEDPLVLYNLACSYALLKRIDLAYATIRLAVQSGYDNFRHMQKDADLKNLFADARFQRYFEKLKQEKEAA